MRAYEFINEQFIQDLEERGKASRKLCKSSKSNDELGMSQYSSCVAQGYRARKTKVKINKNGNPVSINGKKVKHQKYGGPYLNGRNNRE